MFVLSVKANRKNIFYISSAVFFILVLICLLSIGSKPKKDATPGIGKSEMCSTDNNSRVEFLTRFGWIVEKEPTEILEITIPAEFNDTYTNYNNMQKEQGFDLGKYKEKKCKKFVYSIKNYPNKNNKVRANILVHDNKIIGGDISSIEINGFMHGFKKSEN